MPFVPSSFSFLGDAGGSGATSSYVDVYDVQGTGPFRVFSDGTVKLGTRSWPPSDSKHDEVVANLSDVPGNRDKMARVMGSDSIDYAVAHRPAPSLLPAVLTGSSYIPAAGGSTPLTGRAWFWPVVILTSASAVGGAVYYFKGTDHGKKTAAAGIKKFNKTAVGARVSKLTALANPGESPGDPDEVAADAAFQEQLTEDEALHVKDETHLGGRSASPAVAIDTADIELPSSGMSTSTMVVGGIAVVGVAALGGWLWWRSRTSMSEEAARAAVLAWAEEQPWSAGVPVRTTSAEQDGGEWLIGLQIGNDTADVRLTADGEAIFLPGA